MECTSLSMYSSKDVFYYKFVYLVIFLNVPPHMRARMLLCRLLKDIFFVIRNKI